MRNLLGINPGAAGLDAHFEGSQQLENTELHRVVLQQGLFEHGFAGRQDIAFNRLPMLNGKRLRERCVVGGGIDLGQPRGIAGHGLLSHHPGAVPASPPLVEDRQGEFSGPAAVPLAVLALPGETELGMFQQACPILETCLPGSGFNIATRVIQNKAGLVKASVVERIRFRSEPRHAVRKCVQIDRASEQDRQGVPGLLGLQPGGSFRHGGLEHESPFSHQIYLGGIPGIADFLGHDHRRLRGTEIARLQVQSLAGRDRGYPSGFKLCGIVDGAQDCEALGLFEPCPGRPRPPGRGHQPHHGSHKVDIVDAAMAVIGEGDELDNRIRRARGRLPVRSRQPCIEKICRQVLIALEARGDHCIGRIETGLDTVREPGTGKSVCTAIAHDLGRRKTGTPRQYQARREDKHRS